MAIWEGKKYKLDKSENFDEYMKVLGKFEPTTYAYIYRNFIT